VTNSVFILAINKHIEKITKMKQLESLKKTVLAHTTYWFSKYRWNLMVKKKNWNHR